MVCLVFIFAPGAYIEPKVSSNFALPSYCDMQTTENSTMAGLVGRSLFLNLTRLPPGVESFEKWLDLSGALTRLDDSFSNEYDFFVYIFLGGRKMEIEL